MHQHIADGDDDAREILEALRQIQDSPELRAEAATNPRGLIDRMHLSTIARHAVALGIAGLLVAPAVTNTSQSFW